MTDELDLAGAAWISAVAVSGESSGALAGGEGACLEARRADFLAIRASILFI